MNCIQGRRDDQRQLHGATHCRGEREACRCRDSPGLRCGGARAGREAPRDAASHSRQGPGWRQVRAYAAKVRCGSEPRDRRRTDARPRGRQPRKPRRP
jgi:hypothetical protein